MAKLIHTNFYEDTYVKYQCLDCRKEFIVGETLIENDSISCPYCRSGNTESKSMTNDEMDYSLERIGILGCTGIYFYKYQDGRPMLITGAEEHKAWDAVNSCSVPCSLGKAIEIFCRKRDGK